MSLTELREAIQIKQARLAVIGLGYVGLPVACQFAAAGFDVLGVDVLSDRVDQINAGISPIEGNEPGLSELLESVIKSGQFRVTDDYLALRDRDVILIAVETPIDEHNQPRYDALRSVLNDLGPVMQPGALVIIESTIAPGTTKDLVLPLLTESSGKTSKHDFYLGVCPERVMPGKLLANLRNVSRVLGGMTPEIASTMLSLYSHIVQADLDPTDCITAELVKTVENAYRDVQIAFANEVALICEAVGGNVWDVRKLVNKSPYRQMHLPGAGVGGHCIPKDPWLLASGVKDQNVPLRLIPAARTINDSMPHHIINLLDDALSEVGCQISGSRILVMGYAYLEDSDDTRNSPSAILVNCLREMDAQVIIHDPYVSAYQGDLMDMARDCDAAVVMVRHTGYRELDLAALNQVMRTPVLIDGRSIFTPSRLEAAGFTYRILGKAA